MTTSSTTQQTKDAKDAAEKDAADRAAADKAAKAAKKAEKCAVQDCRRKPTTRGLCPAHWQTHRGLATPKEDTPDE